MCAGGSAPGAAGPLCAEEGSSESSVRRQRHGPAVRRSVLPADAPRSRPAVSAKHDTVQEDLGQQEVLSKVFHFDLYS